MLELPYSVKVLQQQPTDSKVGPFFTVAQALLENVPGIRVQGLLTVVITAGKPSLYWFKDGIADSDFVPYVINDAYSSALQFESDRSISGSLFYNTVQAIGYVPGNIAYQNISGGDDSTAVIGNQLRPFKTIGAAIAAIGTLQNSQIRCAAGLNQLFDVNAPYGLKAPNTYYDMYFEPGCTVEYYGTYGLYISDKNTVGSVYGYGYFVNYSNVATGLVDSQMGYTVNLAGSAAPYNIKTFEFVRLQNIAQIHGVRIGDCVTNNGRIIFKGNQTGYLLNTNSGIYHTLTLDTNSKFTCMDFNGYIGNNLSGSGLVLKINNCFDCLFLNCQLYSHGQEFGATMNVLAEIKYETNNSNVLFKGCTLYFASSTAANKIVYFKNTIANYEAVFFQNCILKSKASAGYLTGGSAIFSDNPISFKMSNVLSERNVAGAAITNLLSAGIGFALEPNI